MERSKTATQKRLIIFLALTFAITWMVFSLIPLRGLTYGTTPAVLILAAAMFVPAISSLLTRLITKEGFQNMYLRPRIKGQITAYLLIFFGPTALLLISGALYFLIFPGAFDPELTQLQAITSAGGAGRLSAFNLLIISLLQVVLIGPVINIIPTLGEELGWRGYLLPKLRESFSDRAALLISGVIWGVWHAPVIAMGHNYGTNYIGYPWLGILAMILFCMALGTIEGYATIRMGSVIPAAMIHSVVNAGAALPILLAKGEYNTLLGPAITGIIGGLPMIILAVILLKQAGKEGVKSNIEPELHQN